MNFPDVIIPVLGMLGGFTVAIVLGLPIVKLIVSRFEKRTSVTGDTGETRARLERIEQAVDGIALEVERIAEAQRFTARLLAERAGTPAPGAERPRESGQG